MLQLTAPRKNRSYTYSHSRHSLSVSRLTVADTIQALTEACQSISLKRTQTNFSMFELAFSYMFAKRVSENVVKINKFVGEYQVIIM